MIDTAPHEAWFERHGWQPVAFQRTVWQSMAEGRPVKLADIV